MSVFIGEKNKRVELAERKDATNPNLLNNTASFKGFTVANTTTAISPSKDKLDPLGHVTSHATSTWEQADKFLDIDTSSAYTFSAFIWLNGDQTIKAICRNLAGIGACSNNGTVISGIKSNCWQRISFTFQDFSESHVAFDFEVTDGTVDFWLGSYKLEKGPVATDWCPAYDDYAWTSDITNLQNTVNNIDSTRTPIVNGASGDDLFAFKTSQIRLYDGIGNKCKNLPPAANTTYFTVQYVFEGPDNDGIAIYRTPNNEVWTVGCGNKSYNTGWTRVANSTDITNLQNTIQANKTDVTNLQSMITGLSTKVDSLQQNSLKIVPITQAAYDALSTKDSNTIYAVGG